jgi:hypothetical protein
MAERHLQSIPNLSQRMTAQVEFPFFSKMKKLHSGRTEIFFKTEYVPRRDVGILGELGLGFGVKVCVRMSYRDSEAEQHPASIV